MKEDLCSLLRLKAQTKQQCRGLVKQLLYLLEKLRKTQLVEPHALAKTLHAWINEIGRMWRFSRNNGITEGFHTKMEMINRRAFGFRNFQNYRLRVRVLCA